MSKYEQMTKKAVQLRRLLKVETAVMCHGSCKTLFQAANKWQPTANTINNG